MSEKQNATAQIARVLFEGLQAYHPMDDLSDEVWPRFQSKWRLYREAIVLMVLLSKEQKDKRYCELVREYERVILPSEPDP